MLKKTVEKRFIQINNKAFPATIYREWRKNVRFSIGKRGAILRMPTVLNKGQQEEQIKKMEAWVQQQFSKNERLHQRHFGKDYQSGDVLKIGEKSYTLQLEYTENQTHTAKLKENQIILKLTKKDNEVHLQKAIKHLLSRVIAKDFLPEITQRVLDLNNQFFQKNIRSVNLKYNQTNWGSCSSKTNINLSTRLLFAPSDVVDYVIIHELAHLIEMNHSSRFWAIVEKAMPDYKVKEKWLKDNGHLCDF